MRRSDCFLLTGLWALALGLLLLFAACGGGGRKSPRPPSVPAIPISTTWGTLSLQWACPGQVLDREKVEDDIARAYLKGEQQVTAVAALRLDGAWALFGSEMNPAWNGHHDWIAPMGSRIYLRCPPASSALAHELQHRFAHQLALRCDGSQSGGLELIDHPQGFDLTCRRIP